MAEANLKITRDEPEFLLDVFLQPGDFFWGDSDTRIRTLLGSCVSITIWHPALKVGGMCHFLLPSRPANAAHAKGRYLDGAMELFAENIAKTGRNIKEFQCKAFGGGNMFRERVDNVEVIGEKNIRAVEEMTQSGKLVVLSSDLGGAFYRRVQFNVWSGEVWVKRKATEQT